MDPVANERCCVCHRPIDPREGWGRQRVCSYQCHKRGVQLGLIREVR